MTGPADSQERRTRYLLGRMSQEEQEALEAEYFADDASFEHLEAAKDSLFDAYAGGRMPPADQAAFQERHLSSPEGRWRLTFAQALRRRSVEEGTPRAPRRPAHRAATWAALAACLALGLATTWLARQNARLQTEIDRLQAESRPDPPPVSPQPVPGSTPAAADRPVVKAVRLPVQSPAGAVEVDLVPQTRSIRLEVALRGDEESATFDAIIRRPDGEELWRQEGLAPKRFGSPIVVMAPADALPDGEYVLSIEGEPSREGPERSVRQYRLRLARRPYRQSP